MIGHLQPGMGLGQTASHTIAFGLGTSFGIIEVAIKKVKQGGRFFKEQALHYKKIITQDAEILDTIIQSFIAGIFDD